MVARPGGGSRPEPVRRQRPEPASLPAGPVRLSLEAEDAALLQRALTSYLSDIRVEMSSTGRGDLSGEEQALAGLMTRLEATAQHTS